VLFQCVNECLVIIIIRLLERACQNASHTKHSDSYNLYYFVFSVFVCYLVVVNTNSRLIVSYTYQSVTPIGRDRRTARLESTTHAHTQRNRRPTHYNSYSRWSVSTNRRIKVADAPAMDPQQRTAVIIITPRAASRSVGHKELKWD